MGKDMNLAQMSVIGMIGSMLDEVRKYGLSMILADQTSSVLLNVMAKTHTQVVLNLQLGNDEVSQIIGLEKSALLRGLQTGEAFVKDTRLQKPVLVKTPERPMALKEVSDEEVHQFMCIADNGFWKQHASLTKPYPECVHCPLALCDVHKRINGRERALTITLSYEDLCEAFQAVQDYCVKVHLQRELRLKLPPKSCLEAGINCKHCDITVRTEAKKYAETIYEFYATKQLSEKLKAQFSLSTFLKSSLPNYSDKMLMCIKIQLSKLTNNHNNFSFLFND